MEVLNWSEKDFHVSKSPSNTGISNLGSLVLGLLGAVVSSGAPALSLLRMANEPMAIISRSINNDVY